MASATMVPAMLGLADGWLEIVIVNCSLALKWKVPSSTHSPEVWPVIWRLAVLICLVVDAFPALISMVVDGAAWSTRGIYV